MSKTYTKQDIINFILQYKNEHGVLTERNDIEVFVGELQKK